MPPVLHWFLHIGVALLIAVVILGFISYSMHTEPVYDATCAKFGGVYVGETFGYTDDDPDEFVLCAYPPTEAKQDAQLFWVRLTGRNVMGEVR